MNTTETPAIIEIRIRRQGDERPWEMLPITTSHPRNMSALIESLKELATAADIDTIRWNHWGSLQGHYIIHRD